MTKISERIHQHYFRKTGKVLITPIDRILMAIM